MKSPLLVRSLMVTTGVPGGRLVLLWQAASSAAAAHTRARSARTQRVRHGGTTVIRDIPFDAHLLWRSLGAVDCRGLEGAAGNTFPANRAIGDAAARAKRASVPVLAGFS